ncbi:MAG: OmpA family protein [Pirellulaceae bacterium]|nr:OmpA family protein [Pirellulaceae bacterium]
MIEEDPPAGIPEWVVTFGDMMSLLLTFFIMLVSMSEIKKEDQYQAIVESIRAQFGHVKVIDSLSPGKHKPRESELRVMSTMGRAKRKDTHKGGVPTRAPDGEEPLVRIVRPGSSTGIGTVLFFGNDGYELDDENRAALDRQVAELIGKPQKIEIRGHAAPQLAASQTTQASAMDISYRRGRAVMQYLIEKHQIPPERIRLSSAGAWEPMYASGDSERMRLNPRVEVFMLEETVNQLSGTEEERHQKVLNP